jgi:hypothetical protein
MFPSPRIESMHERFGASLTEGQQTLRNDPTGRRQHGQKREGLGAYPWFMHQSYTLPQAKVL